MASVEKFHAAAVLQELRHNNREIQHSSNPDIDPARSADNDDLTPDHDGLSPYEYYKARMAELYIFDPRRTDINTAFGWVVTLPKEISDPEEEQQFFAAVADFLKERYGPENCVSIIVHRDEGGQPHLHYIGIPAAENNMRSEEHPQTEKLSCIDEDELIDVLQKYFVRLLKDRKNVVNYVVSEFERIYKAKAENAEYEKDLSSRLAKLKSTRQKYMDMYTDDLISREDLNEKIGGFRSEIEALENELKTVSYHMSKGEQLEGILNHTFREIEDIVDVRSMTNAQLKRIVQKIEVDHDGNVEIYLRLFGDLGLESSVLLSNSDTYRRAHR